MSEEDGFFGPYRGYLISSAGSGRHLKKSSKKEAARC